MLNENSYEKIYKERKKYLKPLIGYYMLSSIKYGLFKNSCEKITITTTKSENGDLFIKLEERRKRFDIQSYRFPVGINEKNIEDIVKTQALTKIVVDLLVVSYRLAKISRDNAVIEYFKQNVTEEFIIEQVSAIKDIIFESLNYHENYDEVVADGLFKSWLQESGHTEESFKSLFKNKKIFLEHKFNNCNKVLVDPEVKSGYFYLSDEKGFKVGVPIVSIRYKKEKLESIDLEQKYGDNYSKDCSNAEIFDKAAFLAKCISIKAYEITHDKPGFLCSDKYLDIEIYEMKRKVFNIKEMKIG